MTLFMAIDQGTSSTRVVLFNQQGQLVDSRQSQLNQSYPQSGWVEQDPEQLWQKTYYCIQQLAINANEPIVASGITNQRETIIAWDKNTGECLYPAIVWQDRRTANLCSQLSDYNDLVTDKTGLLLDPYFSATKIKWLLDEIPRARQLADQQQLAVGTVDSFLIWRLTKGQHFYTDVTNASRTMLFNIDTLEWDEELLKLFDIPHDILPQVKSSCDDFGVITVDNVPGEIPICAVAGDQQAASIGQACFVPGMLKSTFGTGCFLMLNTGEQRVKSRNKLLTTIAYGVGNEVSYSLEGSIFNAGTVVKWLRDGLGLINHADETENLAASLSNNEGVYLVPAFTGLGAPHWQPQAKAMIAGLQRNTTKAHFVRAALESVCYQTQDILNCMREDSALELDCLRVDGGMAVNNWLLQYLADITSIEVQRPKQIETTALGVALLAAVGCKKANSIEAASKQFWQLDRRYQPNMPTDIAENLYQGWLNAVENVLE